MTIADLAHIGCPTPAFLAMAATADQPNPWLPYAWLRLLDRELTELAASRAEYLRTGKETGTHFLAIAAPNRHGKSRLGSLFFPAWWLGTFPNDWVILTGHTAQFIEGFSEEIRNLIRDQGQRLFPAVPGLAVSTGSSAKDLWRLAPPYQGGLVATGVGSPPTGRGGHLVILDDPIKSDAEAYSDTYRERLWRWWQYSIRNRLEPGGVIVIIMCVAAGEQVLTAGGPKAVETIQVGDKVWGYGQDGMGLYPVEATRCSGTDQVVTVRTIRRSVRVNARHPFLVVRGACKIGGPYTIRDWYMEWVPAADLHPEDVVVTMKSKPVGHGSRPRVPESVGNRQVDAGFAWFFGFLLGDGWTTRCVRHNRGGAVSWAACCALGEDERLNERVAVMFKRWYGRRPYRTVGRYWRLDSNSAGRSLAAMGLTPGVRAPYKRIPEWVWELKPSRQRAFLRGLVDADGHEMPRNRMTWRLETTSEGLAWDAYWLAHLCGVRMTVPNRQDQFVFPPNARVAFEEVVWSVDLGFTQNRAEGKTLARGWGAPEQTRRWRETRLERVTSVECGSDAPMYDLSIAGPANFVAGGFVTHNSRWVENDLMGHLLQLQEAAGPAGDGEFNDRWRVLRLPALAEAQLPGEPPDPLGRKEGEALLPERYPREKLLALRDGPSGMGPLAFSALFQNNPQPVEGEKFLVSKWAFIDRGEVPRDVRLLRCWDLAATEKKQGNDPDWTVGVLMGRDREGYIYVLDVIRVREDDPSGLIRTTAELDWQWFGRKVRVRIAQDPAQSGKVVAAFYRKLLIGFEYTAELETGDPVARAMPLASYQRGGNVRLLREAPWVPDFVEEARRFPRGHDDQIAAAANAFADLCGLERTDARVLL